MGGWGDERGEGGSIYKTQLRILANPRHHIFIFPHSEIGLRRAFSSLMSEPNFINIILLKSDYVGWFDFFYQN